jgi:hypothetical protein
MGKLLELPDDVWEEIQRQARARRVEPVELLRESLERLRKPDLNELLRARGRTRSRPHPGPCQSNPFPRVQTKDGSLVSERIIQDRI